MAKLETALEPYGLLLHLLDIELMLGRKRRGQGQKKNSPRNVDLDLLLLGDMIIQSTPLTLPHPRLHQRAFVLKPLLDLAPDIRIPGQGAADDLPEGVADQRSSCLKSPLSSSVHSRQQVSVVVIEGPIGAGKTSLATKLAQHYAAHTLLEQPESNPFLERFYRNQARYALPTQLFFLFQRVQQLGDVTQLDLFRSSVVADFLLEKDPLFARLTLADDELKLYEQIFAQLKPQAPLPDLVDLFAGATRHVGRTGAPARKPDRVGHFGNVSTCAFGQLHPLFPPLRRCAGADRQYRTSESDRARPKISSCCYRASTGCAAGANTSTLRHERPFT